MLPQIGFILSLSNWLHSGSEGTYCRDEAAVQVFSYSSPKFQCSEMWNRSRASLHLKLKYRHVSSIPIYFCSTEVSQYPPILQQVLTILNRFDNELQA